MAKLLKIHIGKIEGPEFEPQRPTNNFELYDLDFVIDAYVSRHGICVGDTGIYNEK
jgi:hypothetical protein